MSTVQDDRGRAVWGQLARVTDPELDQPVTELDFIDALDVDDYGNVCVRFRLPTYWCAANFAFMMAHDMKEAVGELQWVRGVRVELLDHFYAESINRGLTEDASFEQTCGGEASGGLDLLRATFRRKAFYARQERLIEQLRIGYGYSKHALVGLTVADLATIDMADDAERAHIRARYLEMRRNGAPDQGEHAPAYQGDDRETAFVSAAGEDLKESNLAEYLRHLRSVRLNSEFNANLCRSVLAARKGGAQGPSAAPDLGPIRRIDASRRQPDRDRQQQ